MNIAHCFIATNIVMVIYLISGFKRQTRSIAAICYVLVMLIFFVIAVGYVNPYLKTYQNQFGEKERS